MNKKNTAHLYKKYPVLYSTRPSIDCDDGWFSLIDELSKRIEAYNEYAGNHPVVAVQIKEKFSSLRFYTGGVLRKDAKKIFALIDAAEEKSHTVCEMCGEQGKVAEVAPCWVKTVCKKCKSKILRKSEERIERISARLKKIAKRREKNG